MFPLPLTGSYGQRLQGECPVQYLQKRVPFRPPALNKRGEKEERNQRERKRWRPVGQRGNTNTQSRDAVSPP